MVDKEVVPEKDGVPQLVSGLIAEGYKHLYIFGITQVRYGAGPLMYVVPFSLPIIIYNYSSYAIGLDTARLVRRAWR
jgi:hypothetical protein